MIISTVADFLKQIHSLQDYRLTNLHQSFPLCKPGFVPLFRTFKKCFNFIHRLKNNFILFDYEFNRITKALSPIKLTIKAIYRDLYRKLTLDCIREINSMYEVFTLIDSPQNSIGTKFHVCVGTSFVAPFVHDFRKQSHVFKQRLQKLHDTPIIRQLVGQDLIDTWNVCLDWLKLKEEIKKGLPFKSQLWRNFFCGRNFTGRRKYCEY